MLTRRQMLRSLGLAGTAMAVPTLLSGCGDRASPQDRGASGPVGVGGEDVALADVTRSLGGAGARPGAVASVQAFTTDLYGRLATTPGNLVCSPYSVAVALAMTRNGARGRTEAEMGRVLHAADPRRLNEGLNSLTRLIESRGGEVDRQDGSTATISLDVANSLWGQRGVDWEPAFLEALARNYGAGMRLVDYVRQTEAARTAINDWTADRTHDRIPEILAPDVLDAYTRLVLVNAIYLKAPWEEVFTRSFTKKSLFTRSDGSRVDADMMNGQLMLAGYGSRPGWRAARLPYVGEKLAMTIVLPDEDLATLERSLDASTLASMMHVPQVAEMLMLHLPRWTFRIAAELKDPLRALGMPMAFDPHHADFSAMTTDEELYIKAVIHQAFIAVDELGTEAAAATAVVVNAESAGPPPDRLNVDRPFLFVIHDVESATPLFIGRVEDPTAS